MPPLPRAPILRRATTSTRRPARYPLVIFHGHSPQTVEEFRETAYWRDNYDLSYILRRDWSKGLGKKLQGKLHLYVGEADN